jgi:hypothetical protein
LISGGTHAWLVEVPSEVEGEMNVKSTRDDEKWASEALDEIMGGRDRLRSDHPGGGVVDVDHAEGTIVSHRRKDGMLRGAGGIFALPARDPDKAVQGEALGQIVRDIGTLIVVALIEEEIFEKAEYLKQTWLLILVLRKHAEIAFHDEEGKVC